MRSTMEVLASLTASNNNINLLGNIKEISKNNNYEQGKIIKN